MATTVLSNEQPSNIDTYYTYMAECAYTQHYMVTLDTRQTYLTNGHICLSKYTNITIFLLFGFKR